MFIMTSISVPQDLIRVYDTNDGTNDVAKLSTVVNQILSGKMRIEGLSSQKLYRDSVFIPAYNIYASDYAAKYGYAEYKISKGMNAHDAYASVGLQYAK